MDSLDEDVSARVLLRNVLHTELPCSPVTRSMSKAHRMSSGTRRSARLRKSDAGLLSPQAALRNRLRQNLHENISSRSSIQPSRKSLSTLGRKVNTPAVMPSLPLDDDDVTARVLLRGILQTEPEMSLLVPDRPERVAAEPGSTESSLCSNRPSLGTSNLDLPDLPTVNLTMAVRGISRKRPRRNVNVSVFERKVEQGEDSGGDQDRDATENLSTVSGASASSFNLSLKTPYVDLHVDRQVLQRKAGKRKAINVEDFEEGVHKHLASKRMPDREHSLSKSQGMLSETGMLEKFTLGLSNTTSSDSSDIVMSNTALYPQPASMVTSASVSLSIHDKDTVTATQIQREVEERAVLTGWRTEDDERMEEDGGTQGGSMEKEVAAGEKKDDDEDKMMEMEEQDALPSEAGVILPEESRGEDDGGGSCDGNNGMENTEDMNEEEEAAGGKHMEEEEPLESEKYEEQKEVESEEEEEAVESEVEEEEEPLESEKDEEQNEAESKDEEEEVVESEKGEEAAAESEIQMEEEAETLEEEDVISESNQEEEEEMEAKIQEVTSDEQVRIVEHIARRAYRSEGIMKIPGVVAGGRTYKSLSHRLQLPDTEPDGPIGEAESGRESEGGASAKWHSGPEEGREAVQNPLSPSHSPSALSSAGSPDELFPSQEPLNSSRGRSLWEGEEPMGGATAPEEGSKEEDMIARAGSPEISPLPPQTPHTSIQAEPHTADSIQGEEELSEEEQAEEDDSGSESEELSMKTPAFIREKKRVQTPGPVSTPNFLKEMMEARKLPQTHPVVKPKAQRKARTTPSGKDLGLPKSYIMSVFKHFAKTTVSSEVYPILKDIMDKYFDRLAEDLEAYAAHAKRKTIEVEDVELLMRRQGFVTDSMPVNVLIERHLPHEYRKLLIPVATSGNKVIPKQRR